MIIVMSTTKTFIHVLLELHTMDEVPNLFTGIYLFYHTNNNHTFFIFKHLNYFLILYCSILSWVQTTIEGLCFAVRNIKMSSFSSIIQIWVLKLCILQMKSKTSPLFLAMIKSLLHVTIRKTFFANAFNRNYNHGEVSEDLKVDLLNHPEYIVLGFVEPSFVWSGFDDPIHPNNIAWFLMGDLLRLSPWSGDLGR